MQILTTIREPSTVNTVENRMRSDSPKQLRLHTFFNSSASYRVRIALALKGLAYDHEGVNIRSGIQDAPIYKALTAAGLVPTLEDDDLVVTQSLAIIDHLDSTYALQAKSDLILFSYSDRVAQEKLGFFREQRL